MGSIERASPLRIPQIGYIIDVLSGGAQGFCH
jgi:hypothetical protein